MKIKVQACRFNVSTNFVDNYRHSLTSEFELTLFGHCGEQVEKPTLTLKVKKDMCIYHFP